MKSTIYIITLLILLSCSSSGVDKLATEKTGSFDKRIGALNEQDDQINTREPIDLLIGEFMKDSAMEENSSQTYGEGDCEGSVSTRINNDKAVRLIKGAYSCGEYGHGKDEYFLRNDRLEAIRTIKSEYYGFEDNRWIYRLREDLYYFDKDSVIIKSREEITNNPQKLIFHTSSFSTVRLAADSVNKAKTEELNQLLNQE